MVDETRNQALFVKVDPSGDLIFEEKESHRQFAVRISDELEQGILAARQIMSDQQGPAHPHQFRTLPIREIQQLTREGRSPEEIRRDFDVDLALIRRFAQQVEQEKSYTIAQFLNSSFKTDKKQLVPPSVEDILTRSIENYGLDYEDVSWKATRVGRDPWHIMATVASEDGRQATAEWTFNPRNNDIVCLNKTARKLFGLFGTDNSPVDHELFGLTAADDSSAPASSFSIKARGPLTPQWMNVEEEGKPSAGEEAGEKEEGEGAQKKAQGKAQARMDRDGSLASGFSGDDGDEGDSTTTNVQEEAGEAAQAGSSRDPKPSKSSKSVKPSLFDFAHKNRPINKDRPTEANLTADPASPSSDPSSSSPSTSGDSEQGQKPGSANEGGAKGKAAKTAKKQPARKTRSRSAIPQWDEILFGN